ncbi:MAG TPA: sugar ABC transporter substrate-binding protein [Ramlibacter sp.]|jgi:ribose transport system substrate-binding protein
MRIAVFTKNLTNPAYGAARLGADRAGAALGAEVLHFVPTTPDDPSQQSALIAEALALRPRPDAVVLSPVHPTQVDAAIRSVAAAGIPMVGFVNPIGAAPSVGYVSSDDEALARSIADYLFRWMHGRGRVLVIGGPVGAYTSEERLRGFRRAAQAHPAIEVAGFIAGDYDRKVARERASGWLLANGPVQACLAANDVMALGALDALQEAKQSAAVVGVNAIPEAIRAIAEHRLLATADFNAMQMAYLATECAVRHLRGQPVPEAIELPVQVVDFGNFRQWDLPYAQRPLVTFEQLSGGRA